MLNNSKRMAILTACVTQIIEVLTLFEKKKRQGISSESKESLSKIKTASDEEIAEFLKL